MEPLDRVRRERVDDDREERGELIDEVEEEHRTQGATVGTVSEKQSGSERRRERDVRGRETAATETEALSDEEHGHGHQGDRHRLREREHRADDEHADHGCRQHAVLHSAFEQEVCPERRPRGHERPPPDVRPTDRRDVSASSARARSCPWTALLSHRSIKYRRCVQCERESSPCAMSRPTNSSTDARISSTSMPGGARHPVRGTLDRSRVRREPDRGGRAFEDRYRPSWQHGDVHGVAALPHRDRIGVRPIAHARGFRTHARTSATACRCRRRNSRNTSPRVGSRPRSCVSCSMLTRGARADEDERLAHRGSRTHAAPPFGASRDLRQRSPSTGHTRGSSGTAPSRPLRLPAQRERGVHRPAGRVALESSGDARPQIQATSGLPRPPARAALRSSRIACASMPGTRHAIPTSSMKPPSRSSTSKADAESRPIPGNDRWRSRYPHVSCR